MTNKHLSETEIQQFCFEQDTLGNSILEHVSKCELCSIKISNYKVIDEKLKNMKKESFNFDLSSMVLEQISADTSSSKFSMNVFFSFLFALMAIFIIGFAGLYVIDILKLQELFIDAFNPFIVVIALCLVIILFNYVGEVFSQHKKLIRLINTL